MINGGKVLKQAERKWFYQRLNINFAVVSAIIERQREDQTEILIQTRWKPNTDPLYSGLIEIPAGCINHYENVYDAITREILEETGLTVTRFTPDIRTKVYAPKDDDCFAFLPFCCQQQLRGGWPRVGFVFRCEVKDQEPIAREMENKEIRWVTLHELEQILTDTPEKVFTLQLPVLAFYLNQVT
jgi:8-oxo-dGTP diphosphatase